MKGLKNVAVAQKRLPAQMLKVRKEEDTATSKKKADKKDSGAPKRPPSAYFVFLEDFRKTYKENFPDNKSVSAVTKAGGEKWRSLSESEKAPYAEKASKKKAEYETAKIEFANKMRGNVEKATQAASEKSTSEVHDDGEEEASS
ncbi:hypothetical protein MLD38_029277 [Melastoma candidum]|uniref:Uncharacterized protein n=1 Tax=Melastoma candidum TaxID=119954 RepID=A0ACB9N3G8_9MYRT|nr:hypothetical protein MLD38_029277 [Melastoma candidum]